jgi:hypothetical protein
MEDPMKRLEQAVQREDERRARRPSASRRAQGAAENARGLVRVERLLEEMAAHQRQQTTLLHEILQALRERS